MSANYVSHQGGSYTFERSLLSAVAEIADSPSGHDVLIVAPCQRPHWWPIQSVVPWLYLPTTIGQRIAAIPFSARQYAAGRSVTQTMRDAHARRITKFLVKNRIDLVWQIAPGYPPLDVPYVATLWDLQHRQQPWFPETSAANEWWAREAYYAEWLGRAMRIIVPNATAREEVERSYGTSPSRIVTIGQPVDPFNDVRAEKTQTAAAGNGYQLFYPAQFWPHKNHVCLLKALRWLREQHDPRWHVVLTGSDKGAASYVRDQAGRLGVADAVEFRGFVSRDSLVDLYCESFAMAFPSFFGPENLPPLEAMSFGCPVVAARVPGATEQLGDACLLFDPLDPGALGSSIATLKDDPDLRTTLIVRGLRLADQNSAAGYVHRVLEIMKDCYGYRYSWPGSWSQQP